MKSNIQKKYYIGTPAKGKWASVYAYKPMNEEFMRKRGEIFAAISMTGPETFNVSTAGNLLLDHLHETYFENPTDKPMLALEKAIMSTQAYLQKILENDQAAETGIDIDLLALVVHKRVASFVSMGQCHAHIYRDGILTDIAPALKDPTGRAQIKIGSMLLKRNDIIILSSPIVVKELTRDDIVEVCVNFSDDLFKKRVFDNNALVSAIMVGYEVDRQSARAERELVVSSQKNELEDEDLTLADLVEQDHTEVEPKVDIESETESEMESEPESEREYLDERENEHDNKSVSPIESLKAKVSEIKLKLSSALAKSRRRVRGKAPLAVTPAEVRAKAQTTDVNYDQPTYKVVFDKIFLILKKAFLSIKKLLLEDILGVKKDQLYLKGKGPGRNWRVILIAVFALVMLLYFSVTSIQEQNATIARENEAEMHLNKAVELIEEVDKVAEIISRATSGEERKQASLEKLSTAESELNKAKEVEKFAEQVEENLKKLESIRDLLNKTIAVVDPNVIVDIAGLFPGANPSDIVISKNELFISDSEYGKIYRSSLSGADLKEFASGLTRPRSITADNNGNIVLLDEDGDRRLATVNREDGTITRHAGTSAFRLGNVAQIEFADIFGGRIYGVDQSIKSVIMLQRSGESYGIPERRFSFDELSRGTDIAISDLKIYLLANIKQGLYRALNNVDDTPVLTGLNSGENLFSATALFVDEVNVYIADPSKKRILIFPKDVNQINLRAQYVYRGESDSVFTNIKEIIANRQNGKLYVLDGTKVYELSLAQLEKF